MNTTIIFLDLAKLPGWFDKWLDVPAGQLGAVLYPDGSGKTFPPGRHILLRWTERLAGRGAGMVIALLPGGAFPIRVEGRVFSHDGQLLEALVTPQVAITAPLEILRNGSILTDLSRQDAQTALGMVTSDYALADLVMGQPPQHLDRELARSLEPVLRAAALEVREWGLVAFWSAEKRARAAEIAAQIELRLQNVELEQKMAAAENQAEYEDFLRQLAAGLELKVSMHPIAIPVKEDTPQAVAPRGGLIRRVNDLLSGLRPSPGTHHQPNLAAMFQKEKPTSEAPASALRLQISFWLDFRWILLYLFAGVILSILAWEFGTWVPPQIFRVLTAIWVAILTLVLGELKQLVERREKIANAILMRKSRGRIQDLVQNNRGRADQLVRAQIAGDLNRGAQVLDDLMSRAYRGGDEGSSRTLRQLREKFNEAARKVMQPGYGQPGYLQEQWNVDAERWERMLDYDDERLQEAVNLANLTGRLQEDFATNPDALAQLPGLESRLDSLLFNFSGRERAVQIN